MIDPICAQLGALCMSHGIQGTERGSLIVKHFPLSIPPSIYATVVYATGFGPCFFGRAGSPFPGCSNFPRLKLSQLLSNLIDRSFKGGIEFHLYPAAYRAWKYYFLEVNLTYAG